MEIMQGSLEIEDVRLGDIFVNRKRKPITSVCLIDQGYVSVLGLDDVQIKQLDSATNEVLTIEMRRDEVVAIWKWYMDKVKIS